MVGQFKGQGPADRSRIDVADEWQVQWWCTHLGCSKEDLFAAVRAVGIQAYRVKIHLKQPKDEDASGILAVNLTCPHCMAISLGTPYRVADGWLSDCRVCSAPVKLTIGHDLVTQDSYFRVASQAPATP